MVSQDWLQRRQVGIYVVAVTFAIGVGAGRLDSATFFERLIDPVLAVLLYVTFLEIPFVRLRRGLRTGGSWRLPSG